MKTRPVKEVKARIQQHRRVGVDYFRLRLLCPEIARLAQPGQFVMLRVNEQREPFLRRPFSFSRIFPCGDKRTKLEEKGTLEICYQVVGRGTSLMTQLREGQRVDILGPLGNGFWLEEGWKRVVLIGGGIGIAPLIAWAEKLRARPSKRRKLIKNPAETPEVLVLIGGKSREKILGIKEFRKMELEPQVSTEDGSLGMKGLATDLLERELLTRGQPSVTIYACGPMPMLAKIAQIAEQFDLPCQVLLESRMACGVGACLGCAVKVRDEDSMKISKDKEVTTVQENIFSGSEGPEAEMTFPEESLMPVISEVPPFRYARACKEGPVFEARKIIWE
ncbi:MAG: dihydroorotate dehydrogenase electron transfer subunit [Pseudomonadota bacterium]